MKRIPHKPKPIVLPTDVDMSRFGISILARNVYECSRSLDHGAMKKAYQILRKLNTPEAIETSEMLHKRLTQ